MKKNNGILLLILVIIILLNYTNSVLSNEKSGNYWVEDGKIYFNKYNPGDGSNGSKFINGSEYNTQTKNWEDTKINEGFLEGQQIKMATYDSNGKLISGIVDDPNGLHTYVIQDAGNNTDSLMIHKVNSNDKNEIANQAGLKIDQNGNFVKPDTNNNPSNSNATGNVGKIQGESDGNTPGSGSIAGTLSGDGKESTDNGSSTGSSAQDFFATQGISDAAQDKIAKDAAADKANHDRMRDLHKKGAPCVFGNNDKSWLFDDDRTVYDNMEQMQKEYDYKEAQMQQYMKDSGVNGAPTQAIRGAINKLGYDASPALMKELQKTDKEGGWFRDSFVTGDVKVPDSVKSDAREANSKEYQEAFNAGYNDAKAGISKTPEEIRDDCIKAGITDPTAIAATITGSEDGQAKFEEEKAAEEAADGNTTEGGSDAGGEGDASGSGSGD